MSSEILLNFKLPAKDLFLVKLARGQKLYVKSCLTEHFFTKN